MTESVEEIYNYVKISDTIATAGQPTASQLAAIQAAGFQVVINLAPPTAPNALADEPDIVKHLGMEYQSIPVLWDAPKLADVARFFAAMQANHGRQVFVHCAANMRVSAFMYLYETLVQRVDPAVAALNLQQRSHLGH